MCIFTDGKLIEKIMFLPFSDLINLNINKTVVDYVLLETDNKTLLFRMNRLLSLQKHFKKIQNKRHFVQF